MKRSILIALALTIGTNALPNAGLADETFAAVCAACRTGGMCGLIWGAPDINRTEAGQPCIAQHSRKQVLHIALNGTVDHTARGGCDRCTDQQIIDTLEYLLSEVQPS